MPHEHQADAKRTQAAKVRTIVGNTVNYTHPTDKASNRSYYENTHLDSLELPTRSIVGPASTSKED